MRRIRISTTLALAAGLATATIGSMAGAPPAGAATAAAVACPLPLPLDPATDLVKLTGVGVDFGTAGLNAGNDPTCSGTLRWDTSGGTIRPTIQGDLILKNSLGVNARLRADYFDVHGAAMAPSIVTATKVGTTNAEQAFPVTIQGFADPLVYEVQVATQILSGGTWVDVDRASSFLSSSTQPADPVLISAAGQDFGTGGLVGGVPVAPGSLTWDLSGGTVTARLTGDLIMVNSLGVSAHVRLKTFDVFGAQVSNVVGATRTPPSNAQTAFPVNLPSAGSNRNYKAVATIEVLVGAAWTPVGNAVTAYV